MMIMSRIHCKLFCHSDSPHLQHLYTGFVMLRDIGLIDITQEIRSYNKNNSNKMQHLKNANHAHLTVVLLSEFNRKLILFFDNHDSMEIDEEDLKNCDIYFKRSFSHKYINEYHSKFKDNICPLGLNYLVLPNRISSMAQYRNLLLLRSFRGKLEEVISSIDTKNRFLFHPRLRDLHSLPKYLLEPKVLFMATAYDPYDSPERPKTKIEERIHINEFRANCIRLLRQELGPNFYGGLEHNKYTTVMYKDVLLEDPLKSRKRNYLHILDKYPIGIATSGLHGSMGWKLAEYVAFSKAIVSEKLHYGLPGYFQPENNYLEFSTPENCVEQSIRLLSDKELRENLMLNNSIYYQRYVKPDMLVFNAISIALKKWNE